MKNLQLKIFIAVAAVALAGGVAFWFFFSRGVETFKSLNFKSLNIETFKSLNFKSLNPEDQRNIGAYTSDQSADMSEIYTNSKYGFSFSYPKEFSVLEFIENNSDIILAKDAAASGVFQISVSPFDEPFDSAQGKPGPPVVSLSNPITKKRILKDIPDITISGDKYIDIGGEKALSFISKDNFGDEILEIWFVHNGNLYQISAFASFGDKLEEIIKTWAFK